MFSNINKDNKIKGIPNGLIVGQFERTTELDENVQIWEEILKKAMKDPDIPLFDNQYVSL